MPTDPYAGLGTPVSKKPSRDPYMGLGRAIAPDEPPTRSLLDTGAEAVGSIPASAVQFGKGLYEAVAHPVKTAGSLLDIAAGGLENAAGAVLPKPVMDFINSMEANPAAAKRAVDTANQFGGQMAARYGSYDRLKNTIATDPVGFAADFSSLLSGGAGIAGRAGKTGAAAKLSRAAELTNPVNALAPAGRAARKIITKAPSVIADYTSPKSAAYMAAAEGRGNDIINAMRNPDAVIVPGSQPTAAQAASPVGATKFASMGAQAEKILPTEYLARAGENEAARLASLRTVGGTPESLAAAKTAREAAAKPFYNAADKMLATSDADFTRLLDRPSMDKVMSRARQLADEENASFQIGQNRPAQDIPSKILNAQGQPMGVLNVPAEYAKYSGRSLHFMKLAFDDLIKNPERFGIGATEARAIGKTRGEFLKWTETQIPPYKTARTTFAEKSTPINQMEVGQFLEGKLTSALDTETGPQRANVFGAAVKEAPATIKSATSGANRFQQLTDLMEPHQIKVIEDIRKDLAREAETKLQANKAGTSEPRIKQLASNVALPSPNLLSRVVTVANEIRKRLSGAIDRKLAIEIATEMLDPKAAASALEQSMVRDFMAKTTGRIAGKAAGGAGKVLKSTPAKIGAQTQNIMTQAENQNAMNKQYNGSWGWDPNTQSAVWEPN